MHSFIDAKTMAKTLRLALAERNVELLHGDCLEIVARQFGLANWNTLAARIDSARPDAQDLTVPRGWFVGNQSDRKSFRLGLDPSAPGAALIESKIDRSSSIDLSEASGFLVQSIIADDYRGRRVRLTANVKTVDADKGTIFMRIDKSPGNTLRFDNIFSRESKAASQSTKDWADRSVILDVPEAATSIHFGFCLQGYGRIWARAFRLESVGKDVATTAGRGRSLAAPTNLDFSQTAQPGA